MFQAMTLLITAIRNEYVLAVADRRSTLQIGQRFIPQDERFNKHVFFAFAGFRGTASFTGLARWKQRSGKYVTTDMVIADVLSSATAAGVNLATALFLLAEALHSESKWLKSAYRLKHPLFTVVFAGFTDQFREPWIALVTDQDMVPIWAPPDHQFEFPAPPPFRIHFAIPKEPCVFAGGTIRALPAGTEAELRYLISLPDVQAYSVANFASCRIRKASCRSAAVGRRVSAIVLPANGWLDTGLWDDPNEPLAAALPRMVYLDGRQWEPSEMKLNFEAFALGLYQENSLLFQSLLERRISRSLKRRLKRRRSKAIAPTVYQILGYSLFGIPWEDAGSIVGTYKEGR